MVLLDQRGTGASTALTTEWLESEQASGKTESELADYVAQFRADAIVRDAEQLRELLGAQRWTVLGQSFGGFCCVHYAGRFPDSLDGIVTLGGLPLLQPTEADIAATYRRCLDVVERKVKAYYRAFPGDIARVRRIMHALEAGPVGLPRGGVLTARRFRTLGIGLGFAGGAERLHELVDACFCARPAPSGSAVEFSLDLAGDAFAPLAAVEEATSHFERNPLYFALHESIYCDGTSSSWAASQAVGQRVRGAGLAAAIGTPRAVTLALTRTRTHTQGATVPLDDGTEAESFIGEMVMPWMAEDYHRLAPWAGLAHKLAERKWPRLYAAWDHQTASDVPLVRAWPLQCAPGGVFRGGEGLGVESLTSRRFHNCLLFHTMPAISHTMPLFRNASCFTQCLLSRHARLPPCTPTTCTSRGHCPCAQPGGFGTRTCGKRLRTSTAASPKTGRTF